MKKILLTTICLAFATFSFSQQVSRYVVASGGNYSTASGISVSSTIGESMVTTLTSTSNVLTQGFQQSFSAPVDPSITIANPMDGSIHYCLDNPTIGFVVSNFTVGLASSGGDGHIHYSVNGGATTMQYDTTHIQLTNLANGSYQFIMELVDNSHSSFSPVISDTVNFTINIILGCKDLAACNYDAAATCDDGSCLTAYGCMDPLANNYDPSATCADNSTCIYGTVCTPVPVTGVIMSEVIHNRATFNWDNMNSITCSVDQMVIRYRELGSSSWTQKFLGNPVGSTIYYGTSKRVLGLTASTTYEYQFKIWYTGVSSPVNWGANPSGTFTTLGSCPNVGNLTVSTPLTTKAQFDWDDSNGPYSFARIKMRVDSISNPTGSSWNNVGGFGTSYPTYTKNKNGLIPGETYRGQSRTWCDPAGGPYKSDAWTSLIFWTQPTVIRLEARSAIANLDVSPNPSRDVFNVTFTSKDIQDLKVRILNIVGEELVNEDFQQFIGEYTKKIDLSNNAKGIYFLEIETDSGVINKKLMLQ